MRGAIALTLALVACGKSGYGNDAAPKLCDYTEASDASNGTAPEMTGLTISGATQEICGNLNSGHYDAGTRTVDADTFRVTASGQADLRVRFFGATGIDNLDEFSVLVFDTNAAPGLLAGGVYNATLGDHGVFRASLPAGTYDVVVRARAAADIAAPIAYKVRFLPELECPQITGKPGYSESHDGASNTGNDTLAVDFARNPSVGATSGDPEPTGKSFDPGTQILFQGSAANVTGSGDPYLDRDTYEIATGKSTNELSVRLDWPGSTADLDYLVVAEMSTTPTGAATTASQTGPEIAIFPVKPNTKYWLWVGAAKTSTMLPVTYGASVCASNASP
jgi:hypothetical protein